MSVANPHPPDLRLFKRNAFAHSPLVVYYEITRAGGPQTPATRSPRGTLEELSHERSRQLIGELRTFPAPPTLIFCGGDPLERSDLPDLIAYATRNGLATGLILLPTARVTRQSLLELKTAGLGRIAVALHVPHAGLAAKPFDHLRTLAIIKRARSLGLPVRIATTLSARNRDHLSELAELLDTLDIDGWTVNFPVPDESTSIYDRFDGKQAESVFAILWEQSHQRSFPIRTGQAPHYRRYVQRIVETAQGDSSPQQTLARYGSQLGTNDGNGLMYITDCGEICPSGPLPLVCGRFPFDSVVKTYQQHELFIALRDENRLGGKCGLCTYRPLCGGSRARAFAATGDPLAPEPDCIGHFPE